MREISKKLQQALRWRDDVADGEMIEARGWKRDYMAYQDGVSSKELATICDVANLFYEKMGSNLRIGWSMGELRPYLHK